MPPVHVNAAPSEVRARIQGALHEVGGLWFVPGDARRRWKAASAPLFVQWTSETSARVGPRLGSPDVSRFCPLWTIRLEKADTGTEVHFAQRLDPLSAALGAFWGVMVCVAGVFIVNQINAGDQEPGAIAWWLFLVLAFATVAVISAVQGGRTLEEARPWFERILEVPSVEDEWV